MYQFPDVSKTVWLSTEIFRNASMKIKFKVCNVQVDSKCGSVP